MGKHTRSARLNPLQILQYKHTKFCPEEVAKLAMPVAQGVEAFLKGTASREDWDNVAKAINLVSAFLTLVFVPTYRPETQAAERAMRACVHRVNLVLTKEEAKAVTFVAEVYYCMLENVTVVEFNKAHEAVLYGVYR